MKAASAQSANVPLGFAALYGASRAVICSQAFSTAMPLRSAEAEAADDDALATVLVDVSEMNICAMLGAEQDYGGTCLFWRDTEAARGDLHHLDVQSLAHLHAAVRDQHRAVRAHMHERARLSCM